MIQEALDLFETTNGAFEITIYPLMELWGFTSGDFSVPNENELKQLLSNVGSDKLIFDEDSSTLILGENQGVDLGGIAKGFTSMRLMDIFEEYELVSGVVSLGGNVQCYHSKPDGSLWRCGIENPFEPDDTSSLLGILSVENKAVITSGAYERYFIDEQTGKTYHHILDPKTGYPAENGLVSVTVVSENGMLADGLSTACYVMGLEESLAYWQEYGQDFDLILMDENKEVYVTESLADFFTSDFSTHIVYKEG
jgi:thiamine biosynthesis lipoprotein